MKTTNKDFEYFKKRCNHWIDFLSIKEWSIHHAHEETNGTYATTHWNINDGVATVVFSTYWDDLRPKTRPEIDRLALHEVLHLVMAPLVHEALERFSSQATIESAEHRIIRQLEHLVRID